MSRRLIVIEGPDKGRIFELEGTKKLLIGRGQASDTKINDPRMSRIHCELVADGDRLLLRDRESSGGTFVNGERVTEVELAPGNTINAGESGMRFDLGNAADHPTMTGGLDLEKPKARVGALAELKGTQLGPYKLTDIIAKGSSGMVFKARDDDKSIDAAVKVLTPEYTSSDEQRQRFVRAMQTMLPIHDPHIIQLYNAGKNGPYCWAAMQYVDGESLTMVIDRIGIEGMLSWQEVWRTALHIGRALRTAYNHKIIHRNVTPTNIMRRSEDKAFLLGDLMLAKALEGTMAQQITQPGQLIGDIPYMSPERTRDQGSVDCRSDLYGLGATCYALLTGRAPVEGDTLPELIKNVRGEMPPEPRKYQLAINELFQGIVMKLIAKDPSERFQTPMDLLTDLERVGKFNSLQSD